MSFTWITDCSGVRHVFENDLVPTHKIQRWKIWLLNHNFTIVHRPNRRMMVEVDVVLSRHNQFADDANLHH